MAVEGFTDRPGVVGGGAVLAAVALGSLFDAAGLVAGLIVLAAWYVLAPAYAFGASHVALVAAVPATDLERLLVVEIGLLWALLAPAATTDGDLRPTALAAGPVLVVGGLWLVGGPGLDRPAAAAAVVAGIGLVVYGLDRYGRAVLGAAGGGGE